MNIGNCYIEHIFLFKCPPEKWAIVSVHCCMWNRF